MSKEEELKSVDLRVSVNCCEGCKRKISKALSIKGVLKTEIHPTLPKITVTGYVDVQMLIGRLAKRGKKAELWPKQPEPEKDVRVPECVTEEKEDEKRNVLRSHDTDTVDDKVDRNSVIVSTDTATPRQVIQVNCLENPNMVPPIQSYIYYQMEPHPVPMTYYTANADVDADADADAGADADFSIRPSCCHQHRDHCELPVYLQPAPVEARQPTDFADYFNDDNTVGCYVM